MHSGKKLPLLHIGYGKTATTWFQQCFYPKVEGIEFFDAIRLQACLSFFRFVLHLTRQRPIGKEAAASNIGSAPVKNSL